MGIKEIPFVKMHGLGNDYVYVLALESDIDNPEDLARKISDRHFGVGGDGLVMLCKSDKADFKMRMFNNDGSEAQMCGNASRCIAKLIFDRNLSDKQSLTLETLAGIKQLRLNLKDGRVESVTVNMGKPVLDPALIPVKKSSDSSPTLKTVIDGTEFEIFSVSMGNPHGVIFQSLSDIDFEKFGPLLEHADIWPEKANIEFVEVVNKSEIGMRVWERGTGETLACGTGACASAVASILSGQTDREVLVRMKGGDLKIKLNENDEVEMTGEAVTVAEGIYFYEK